MAKQQEKAGVQSCFVAIVTAGADAEHLGEATGEVFGVVEADLIGNLGDVAVAGLR